MLSVLDSFFIHFKVADPIGTNLLFYRNFLILDEVIFQTFEAKIK